MTDQEQNEANIEELTMTDEEQTEANIEERIYDAFELRSSCGEGHQYELGTGVSNDWTWDDLYNMYRESKEFDMSIDDSVRNTFAAQAEAKIECAVETIEQVVAEAVAEEKETDNDCR